NVKLLMHWDIKQEREQDYFEFVVREWMPGLTRLGMEPTGAWYTAYSRTQQAQIMTEAVAEDLDTLRKILSGTDWQHLHGRLLEYVNNYDQKIVRVSGGFQM
ncbi:MAG TPA: hypothetical protein VHO69_06285, partial [Phototrophicaceae bacterium]|nr:hypothetical protein [Phototrophicaceae bacterium]